MENKENQRIMLTKRLLKESLFKLLEKKNIKKISVCELCQDAGINRSTFYNHYGSQFDLLKEMELDMIDDLNQIWESEHQNNSWTLNKRVSALCTYFKENEKFVKRILSNEDTNSEFASLLIEAAHVQTIYKQVFSDVKDECKLELMMTFLINGTYQMVRRWLLENIPLSPDEMGELVFKMSACDWEIPGIPS
ncbi:MAG: TetR/AcrR family transcriptional regulator [Acutalibacteraceae bacterium]